MNDESFLSYKEYLGVTKGKGHFYRSMLNSFKQGIKELKYIS